MKEGQFVLRIVGKQDVDGYVRLAAGERFAVRLENHGDRRVAVPLHINGEHQGTFVLDPKPRTTYRIDETPSWGAALRRWTPPQVETWWAEIERSGIDGHDGFFKAVRRAGAEGQAGGAAEIDAVDSGVVSASFIPEKAPAYTPPVKVFSGQGASMAWRSCEPVNSFYSPDSASNRVQPSDVAAVVVQDGHSDQRFNTIAAFALDEAATVGPLELRLVVTQDGPRPLPRARRKAPPPLAE